MSHRFDSVAGVLAAVGADLGSTEWMVLAQGRIDRFADATDDRQWIHVDPARAAQGPFGGCIAHGYLTVSYTHLPMDVRDADRVAAVLAQAADAFGALDIVVAGQAGNFFAPALSISPNGFRSVVEIDLIGTFTVFRLAWPHLRRPGASLLAISAPQAVRPLPMQAHACAAKAGVNLSLIHI